MDAGDALHGLAVAQRQALAVDVLQAADHRVAVAGDRDALLVRQLAGHRRAPQVFAVQLRTGEAMDALEVAQGVGDVGFRGRDEFQQRLGIVGGDLRMGQGRAQGAGMGVSASLPSLSTRRHSRSMPCRHSVSRGRLAAAPSRARRRERRSLKSGFLVIASQVGRPNMRVDRAVYKREDVNAFSLRPRPTVVLSAGSRRAGRSARIGIAVARQSAACRPCRLTAGRRCLVPSRPAGRPAAPRLPPPGCGARHGARGRCSAPRRRRRRGCS